MKLTPPGSASNQGQRRTPPRVPREVIAEIREGGYLPLICGHMTSKDTQEQYSAFRPKGKQKFFCEKCGSWESTIVRKVVIPPETPMF